MQRINESLFYTYMFAVRFEKSSMKDRKLTAFNSVRIRYLTKVKLKNIGKRLLLSSVTVTQLNWIQEICVSLIIPIKQSILNICFQIHCLLCVIRLQHSELDSERNELWVNVKLSGILEYVFMRA